MYWLDAKFSAQISRRRWHWRDSLAGVGRWKTSRRASLTSYACWSPAGVHEIAQRLHLSIKTIHNLHYQIKTKLGVTRDIELARLAMSWGLDLSLTLENSVSNGSHPPT